MAKNPTREFSAQGYLLYRHLIKNNAHMITPKKKTGRVRGAHLRPNRLKNTTTIHRIKGSYQPEVLMSLLASSRQSNFKHFLDLEPYKITALVPEIKLFKIDRDAYKPFYFPIKVDKANKETILSRGTLGISGIKSFNMSFVGTDFFTADKIIACELSIYTDNLDNLFAAPPAGHARLVDLFAILKKKKQKMKEGVDREVNSEEVRTPSNNEVVASIGYALPLAAEKLFNKLEISAIEESRFTLRMNYNKHDISVGQDGTATINISFNSRLDSLGADSFFDLMQNGTDLADLTAIRADMSKASDITDSIAKKKKMKELQRKISVANRIQFRKYLEFLDSEDPKTTHLYDHPVRLVDMEMYQSFDRESVTSSLGAKLGKEKQQIDKDIEAVNADPAGKAGAPGSAAAEMIRRRSKEFKSKIASLEAKKKLKEQEILEIHSLRKRSKQISWVYFGDLLESVIHNLVKNLDIASVVLRSKGLPDKEKKARHAVLAKARKQLKSFKILLSDIDVKIANFKSRRINLADVPISLEVYQQFVFEKVEQTHRRSYTLRTFLDDCVNVLLPKALSHHKYRDAPDLDVSINLKSHIACGENLSKLKADIPLKEMPRFLFAKPGKKKSDETDYFIIYSEADRKSTLSRSGDKNKDSKDGIYHLHLGKNKGLLKTIEFTMYDIEYRKESLMLESVSIYDQLKMPYKASITMFGNNLFFPGSMVYINPSSIGFGDPRNTRSSASRLGIGGYYQIISVRTDLTGQSMTTVLETSHNISFASDNPFSNEVSTHTGETGTGGAKLMEEKEKLWDMRAERAEGTAPPAGESEKGPPIFSFSEKNGPYEIIESSDFISDEQKKIIIRDHTVGGTENIDPALNIRRRISPGGDYTYDVQYDGHKVEVLIKTDGTKRIARRQ